MLQGSSKGHNVIFIIDVVTRNSCDTGHSVVNLNFIP